MKNYCFLLLLTLVFANCNQPDIREVKTTEIALPPTACQSAWKNLPKDSLSFAVRAAADYLRAQVMDDGKFVYNRNLDDNIKVAEDYNVLRHAGTIYAMTQAYQVHPDPALKIALLKAAAFLKRETIAPLPGQSDSILAIWSRPELIISSSPPSTKLGGAGISLLALLSVEKMSPGFTGLDTLRGLGTYIRFMQKPDGSYHSKYYPESQQFDRNFVSLYYPGEAALGLFELYQLDPQQRWLETGLRFLTYMAGQRKTQGNRYNKSDHWALLATQKLLAEFESELQDSTRQLLVDHAVQNLRNMVRSLRLQPGRDNGYPIGGSGNVNNVGTSMEGLIAILPYVPEDLPDRTDFCACAANGVGYLLRSQIKDGPHRGGFTKKPSFHPYYSRTPKNAEIRIDNVQHSMSGIYWMYLGVR